ncbi:hypothetical protein M199_gp006 [Halogranum tailed virus 1]|uniref:Uncharacterized protein n=1 Tax=Halogranum tailed virus 1 TaxID=1273749 RepID=R4TGG8_9CAUD|nr:hypothetical protein M199_gp006 [Halogranum tailed virus 1]AGM11336.1 hypothetical protein HGTV1_6 [Halogranum tailed virus 1]
MTEVFIVQGDNLKSGDTDPDLVVKLRKDNANAFDLSGTPTVSFYMREIDEDTLAVDDDTTGNVTIEDASTGKVSYSWQSGDTDLAGTYIFEFEVDDGQTRTFPNKGYGEIRIQEALK